MFVLFSRKKPKIYGSILFIVLGRIFVAFLRVLHALRDANPFINHRKIQNVRALLQEKICLSMITGCSTTNSVPYKASTSNVITIQQSLGKMGKKVSIGNIIAAKGIDESPVCRLMGPVNVAPGKTLSQYIKDAFQEELFLAGVYSPNAPSKISGTITSLDFSSVSPANWDITMAVKSNNSSGYSVSAKYPFNTSFDAYSAYKNVANAFGPAVQTLIKKVVTHPQFNSLAR